MRVVLDRFYISAWNYSRYPRAPRVMKCTKYIVRIIIDHGPTTSLIIPVVDVDGFKSIKSHNLIMSEFPECNPSKNTSTEMLHVRARV